MEPMAVADLITTVGFPIACVIGLAFFVWKAYNNMTAANKEREDKYIAMLGEQTQINSEFRKTLGELVGTINEMNSRLENIEHKMEE